MKRRSNGEGSIFHDKKRNHYVVRLTYEDSLGIKKRKHIYAATAAEAKHKAKEWKKASLSTDNKLTKNPLVGEWIDEWLETYVKNAVRPATYKIYKVCLAPIKQAFSKYRLDQLEPTQLQNYFNKQLAHGGRNRTGLSPFTVRNQRRYFANCIDTALKLGLTNKNPVRLTKSPKQTKTEIQPLSQYEAQTLIKQAQQELEEAKTIKNSHKIMVSADLYIGIYIALETGMRLGEIMALRWSDIVIDSYITVQRSKSEVKEQNITSPKTGIGRKVQISQRLISALKEHKRIQNAYKKELEDLYENDYRIIGGLLGKGFHARHYSSRLFKQLLQRAGIDRRIRFHDLRHTHATLLLLSGVNPKIVQERLGHSSINVTLDIYSHVALADQAVAISALDKLNL